MTAKDIVVEVRDILGEPSQNRWPDAAIMRQISATWLQIATDVDYPEATYTFPRAASLREFALPSLVKILRAYILTSGGSMQPLVPSTINLLEGDIQQVFDQSSGIIQGQPSYSPQLFSETAQGYPVTSPVLSAAVPTTTVYLSVTLGAQRPVCYIRGGSIGIVPTDAGGSDQVALDILPQPMAVTALAQVIPHPSLFLMAFVWGTVMLCRITDNPSDPRVTMAARLYTERIKDLRSWRDNMLANKPKAMVPITKRTFISYRSGYDGEWDFN